MPQLTLEGYGARSDPLSSRIKLFDVFDEDRADRMNGFMPIEPFGHQSLRRASHRDFTVRLVEP